MAVLGLVSTVLSLVAASIINPALSAKDLRLPRWTASEVDRVGNKPERTADPHPTPDQDSWDASPTTAPPPPTTTAAAPVGTTPVQGWRPNSIGFNGEPIRWDPCTTIIVSVDPKGSPTPNFEHDVEQAISKLTEASRLTFRFDTVNPSITIGWSTASRNSELAGRVAGVAATTSDPSAGRFRHVRILLDADDIEKNGFQDGFAAGPVLLHELGHALGLDHVDDPTQLMYPFSRPDGPTTFGTHDLTGLQALGGPCPI